MTSNRFIYLQHYHSPCGELMLGSFDGKLCLCNWVIEKHPGRVDARLKRRLKASYKEEPSDITREAARQLDEYFGHKRQMFHLPLLTAGTDFQERVWRQLMEIPYAQTVSYGELARMTGNSQAVRAVANANGANAISIFIPCHRVIGSDHSLTGYGGGLQAKTFLLKLEQAW